MDGTAAEKVLSSYIGEMERVEGWLSPTTAYAMGTLLRWQTGRKETGGVADIGIRHGKSFLRWRLPPNPKIDCWQ